MIAWLGLIRTEENIYLDDDVGSIHQKERLYCLTAESAASTHLVCAYCLTPGSFDGISIRGSHFSSGRSLIVIKHSGQTSDTSSCWSILRYLLIVVIWLRIAKCVAMPLLYLDSSIFCQSDQ